MARKRFVTSEISTDEKISLVADESPTAALMWPWFITAFDDWGLMNANPVEIKLTIFPAFPFTPKDITEAISLFDKIGLAHKYTVDNRDYLAIYPKTWFKYQTYIKKERIERQSSKFPAPPNPPWENRSSQVIADNPQQSAINVLSLSLSPSLSKDPNNNDNARARDEINFVKTYEQEFGRLISPTEYETLQSFTNDGMDETVICEAIKRTRLQGKTNVSYTKKILVDWLNKGVLDLNGVSRVDLEHQNRARDRPKGGTVNARAGPDIQQDLEEQAARREKEIEHLLYKAK